MGGTNHREGKRKLTELDTVREEEVDTGSLLSDLEDNTDQSSETDSVGGREALLVARLSHRVLGNLLELDDLERVLDLLVVDVDTTETGDSPLALLVLALLGIVRRRLGRESESEEEKETPSKPGRMKDNRWTGSSVS